MSKASFAVCLVLCLSMNELHAELSLESGRQRPNQLTVAVTENGTESEKTIPFLLFVPRNYPENTEPLPLLLFLHGLGECGDGNLELVKMHGPPRRVESDPDFPFVVVSPQCPQPAEGQYREAWQADQLIQLVDHAARNLRVDPQRIYVTGLSMGGYGTWRLAARYPDRFAAAVPICGGGKLVDAERLKALPIWCFHGAKDDVVPVDRSQEMTDAIQKAGGNVKLTIYPEAEHDSWTETYHNPRLYDWLLAQRRRHFSF